MDPCRTSSRYSAMDPYSNRKRLPVFSQEELDFLKDYIANSYKDVIDDRANTKAAIAKKTAAWEDITKKFNANPRFTRRNEKHLKKCWDNMKSQQKRTAQLRYHSLMMGGAPDYEYTPSEQDAGDNEGLKYLGVEMAGMDSDVKPSNASEWAAVNDEQCALIKNNEIKTEEVFSSEYQPQVQLDSESLDNAEDNIPSTSREVPREPNDELSLKCKRVELQIEQDAKLSALVLEEMELKKETAALALEAQRIKNKILQVEYEKAKIDLLRAKGLY